MVFLPTIDHFEPTVRQILPDLGFLSPQQIKGASALFLLIAIVYSLHHADSRKPSFKFIIAIHHNGADVV